MDAKDLRLRPRKVQLQAVFKAAAVGFALLDLEGRIIMTNPALQKMFGFDRKVIDGMMLGELIHSGEVDKILAQYDELVSGKLEHFQIEMPYSTKEGRSFWGRVTFSLAQESGNGFRYSIAIVEDITEQKLLSNQLIQSQKMEAVARLAGGIAHDFKNLLSAILCYGNILLKNIKEEDPLYTYTMNIMNASSRGISLARQLFIYGQRDISQPQVINLNNLIADMDYMLRNLLREDITMITILDPFLGNVKADPGQIEQVIMNLVVNARDAMSSGGKLVIETANIDIDEPWACLSDSLEPGPYVTLTVTDTGSGIDDETMAHIFEPFFTTKDPDKGTGLGLSVACGIIKQMQGHIEAHSVPGGGATFAIYLPQNFDSLDQPQKTDNFALVPFMGSETILVVEDEEILRIMICEILRRYGYHVLEAAGSGEALLTCEQYEAPIHLMITDMVMPMMSGRELAVRLSGVHPEMDVIYMSGYMEHFVDFNDSLDETVPFLQKPFKPLALIQKVREVLDNS